MFDVIGDIHGHADELARLLEQLGYSQTHKTYVHPHRKALFVGDFLDRVPQIRRVLHLVRRMIDAGSAEAVLGNHEFNAIAYHTRDASNSERFLREHSEKNNHQHRSTLAQVPSQELAEWIAWFRTLPFALELPGLCVAHACWDPRRN